MERGVRGQAPREGPAVRGRPPYAAPASGDTIAASWGARPVGTFRPLGRSGTVLTPPAAALPATWSPNAALRPFPPSSRFWPVPLEMDSSGSTRIPGAPSFLQRGGMQIVRVEGVLDITRKRLHLSFLFLCLLASLGCILSFSKGPRFFFLWDFFTPEIP